MDWRRAAGRVAELIGPLLGLLIVVASFQLWIRSSRQEHRDVYISEENVRNVLKQTAVIGTCAVGMTLVIVGGGIDLSVGSVVALSSVVVTLVAEGRFRSEVHATVLGRSTFGWIAFCSLPIVFSGLHYFSTRRISLRTQMLLLAGWGAGAVALFGSGAGVAAASGALVGLACGYLNGLLVTSVRVAPFIITLGSMEALRGLAIMLGRQTKVNLLDFSGFRADNAWLDGLMLNSPRPSWLIVAPAVWITIAAGIAAAILLGRTVLGRYLFAIGGNEEAARLSGLPVPSVKIAMYSLLGLLAGVAGVMRFAESKVGDPSGDAGLELQVIAAVVIGGGSLRGGAGSIGGTLVGALMMAFLRNGCVLAQIPNAVERVLIGVIIILAVAVDELRHRGRG